MARTVIVLKVQARLRDRYTCFACGAQEFGTSYSYESERSLPDLEHSHCSPHDMPVGWASYGFNAAGTARVFKCRACNEKENPT